MCHMHAAWLLHARNLLGHWSIEKRIQHLSFLLNLQLPSSRRGVQGTAINVRKDSATKGSVSPKSNMPLKMPRPKLYSSLPSCTLLNRTFGCLPHRRASGRPQARPRCQPPEHSKEEPSALPTGPYWPYGLSTRSCQGTAWLVTVLRGATKPRSMLHNKTNLKTARASEHIPSGACDAVAYRDHSRPRDRPVAKVANAKMLLRDLALVNSKCRDHAALLLCMHFLVLGPRPFSSSEENPFALILSSKGCVPQGAGKLKVKPTRSRKLEAGHAEGQRAVAHPDVHKT